MSKVGDFQTALAARIDALTLLSSLPEPITALIFRGPEIETQIAESIAKGLGTCIVVSGVSLTPLGDEELYPRYRASCNIAIAQQPTLDGSGLELLDIVEAVLATLFDAPQLPNRTKQWRVVRAEPVEDPDYFAYSITVESALLFA